MALIAVTGARGFVGRHLVPHLLGSGHSVRCLVRPGPGASRPSSDAGELIGDVRNLESVRRLIDGCSQVVHLAASFRREDDAREIIEIGTANVVATAAQAGVERLVFVSCLGADAAARSDFYAAKWRAEMMVRASGVPYAILRPSLILGSEDGVVAPLSRLISKWPLIPIPGHGEQRTQPVDVEDVVRCIVLALEGKAAENEQVSVGGPMFLTIRELIDLIAAQVGVDRPKLLLPNPLFAALGNWMPMADVLRPPRLAQWEQGVVASPGIIQREFGFVPRSVVDRLPGYLA